jgi:hypothetical protein
MIHNTSTSKGYKDMIAIISSAIIILFVILNVLSNRHTTSLCSVIKSHNVVKIRNGMFIYNKHIVVKNSVFMYDLAMVNNT